jgi:hypothetical protein
MVAATVNVAPVRFSDGLTGVGAAEVTPTSARYTKLQFAQRGSFS